MKSGFNKFKNSAMGKVIEGMIPRDATEGLAAAPGFVIKTLPDGSKIKVIKEGISGATKRAKRQFADMDRYNSMRTDNQLITDDIVSAMRQRGLNPDEREIFTNVSRGNAAIYDKIIK